MGSGRGGYIKQPDGSFLPVQQHQDNIAANDAMASFNASATAPIPGLTGQVMPGANIPGLLGQQPVPMAPPRPMIGQGPPSQFQPSGPYGQQAMMLAGLLGQPPPMGRSPQPTQMGQGLLANPKRGPRMMLGATYGK